METGNGGGMEGSVEGVDSGINDGFEGEKVDFFTEAESKAGVTKKRVEAKPKQTQSSTHEAVRKPVATEKPESTGEKIRVVIDGEEKDLSLDELKSDYQLKQASYKRMQEASALQKRAQATIDAAEKRLKDAEKFEHSYKTLNQLVDQLKTDPEAVFRLAKDFGHDPKKLAEEKLWSEWQRDNLTPEQKELMELRNYRSQIEKQNETRAQQEAEQQHLVAKQQFASDLNGEFTDLFKEIGGRPDPVTLMLTIDFLKSAYEKERPISVKEAHQRVQALQPHYRAKWLENMADTDFESLPDQFLSRVRERDVAKFKQAAVPGRKASSPSDESAQALPKQKKNITVDDFFDQMDKRRRG